MDYNQRCLLARKQMKHISIRRRFEGAYAWSVARNYLPGTDVPDVGPVLAFALPLSITPNPSLLQVKGPKPDSSMDSCDVLSSSGRLVIEIYYDWGRCFALVSRCVSGKF